VSNLRFKEKEKVIFKCSKKMEYHQLICGKAWKKNGSMWEKLLTPVHKEDPEDKVYRNQNIMKEISFSPLENMIIYSMLIWDKE
jgi:hypothetical protein